MVGVLAFAGGGFTVHRLYAGLLAQAREAERTATDRLVAAHRDGFVVPPKDEAPHVTVVERLGPATEDYLSQFDDAGFNAFERKARQLMAAGVDDVHIVLELDRLRTGRAGSPE